MIVYVLALLGVRGAEVFRDPAADRREGLRHQSVETTHQAYHDVQAEETARPVDDILNSE